MLEVFFFVFWKSYSCSEKPCPTSFFKKRCVSEVPGGAADGYVFSWEGVATQAATTRCLSRFVPPPRSGGGSSELVRMLAIRNIFSPPTHFLISCYIR